ncbi:hypothetical protein [Pedobacter gandavensis]|uniref:hypothetical protein n=1 Tax=Pedobacter gandavensis TaxID=2679963 RepID=UPI0029314C63|nr:hypothetical protein [Pedobacter gandavensis]
MADQVMISGTLKSGQHRPEEKIQLDKRAKTIGIKEQNATSPESNQKKRTLSNFGIVVCFIAHPLVLCFKTDKFKENSYWLNISRLLHLHKRLRNKPDVLIILPSSLNS